MHAQQGHSIDHLGVEDGKYKMACLRGHGRIPGIRERKYGACPLCQVISIGSMRKDVH